MVQATTLAAIAGVCALRLPLAMTILVTFGVYVLAHVAGAAGWPVAGPLPALSLFNVDDALQFAHVDVDPWYFPLCAIYGAIYSIACLLIGAAIIARLDIP